MTELHCALLGVGVWGRGFENWNTLQTKLLGEQTHVDDELTMATPKPVMIPANERRRAPLLVKMAVEVSDQALQQSGLKSEDVACVFGSGLGDTEITDYMCRVLASDVKQLSPTKFHNSVHNAAAGYWTISSECMKVANSVAAYHETAGLAFLEAITHCSLNDEPVLITLFDDRAHAAYRSIFDADEAFACSFLICPDDFSTAEPLVRLSARLIDGEPLSKPVLNGDFTSLYERNPAAKALSVLSVLARWQEDQKPMSATLKVSSLQQLLLTFS